MTGEAIAELLEAAAEAARAWPRVASDGDTNTIDLYWHAGKVRERLRLRLPASVPPKGNGIAIVELVEKHLIPQAGRGLLRDLEPSAVSERSRQLTEALSNGGLRSIAFAESYATALYAWHGCLNMAKLCRRTHVVPGGEAAYSDALRTQGYDWLQECWTREMANGNPWVRYGASLARPFEMNRKRERFDELVVEHWVPRDSPYWES